MGPAEVEEQAETRAQPVLLAVQGLLASAEMPEQEETAASAATLRVVESPSWAAR
jgi:hypothetical protein